ncbi:hypothetical protein M2263_004451 [Providencia alcalifaciens]|nr:hypothetical protein [Providencia alcalifaciens]
MFIDRIILEKFNRVMSVVIYYIVFLAFSSGLLLLSRTLKSNIIIFSFAVLIAIFFSGFRHDAGNDYFTYYGMAKGYYWFDKLEISPRILLSIAKTYDSPMLYFLSTSIIYITSVAYFCWKRSKNPELSFFLFLSLPLSLLTSFGYVRQYVAIGLFLLSLSTFIDKRYILSSLFFILAVSFHTSAIIFIVIFIFYKFLSNRIYPIWLYLALMAVSYPVAFFIAEYAYLAGNYQEYLIGAKAVDSGKKIGLVCVALFFYFWLFNRHLKSKDDIYIFNIYYVFALIYLILMDFGEYVSRVSYYLMPCSYVLFVSTLYLRKNIRAIQICGIICFSLAMFFATLYFASTNPVRDFLTNYSLILFYTMPN